jgi:hypothetical protein
MTCINYKNITPDKLYVEVMSTDLPADFSTIDSSLIEGFPENKTWNDICEGSVVYVPSRAKALKAMQIRLRQRHLKPLLLRRAPRVQASVQRTGAALT